LLLLLPDLAFFAEASDGVALVITGMSSGCRSISQQHQPQHSINQPTNQPTNQPINRLSVCL